MSTSISRRPQNGGSGTGVSVRAAERTELSLVSPCSGSGPFSRSRLAASRVLATSASRGPAVDELVHLREALEGVLAVEDAGVVERIVLAPVRIQRAQAEVAVDRRAADEDRGAQLLLVELLDAHRHLLRRRDEQRAQADRRRVVLLGRLEDRLDRDLLAQVDDRVAVVREDRVDERLADVVHVAEDRREDDRALRVALELVEVLLELRD